MKQDIINELNKDIEIKKELLKAWQQVKFVTKKDGTPFKSIQKNIVGASYRQNNILIAIMKKNYIFVLIQNMDINTIVLIVISLLTV